MNNPLPPFEARHAVAWPSTDAVSRAPSENGAADETSGRGRFQQLIISLSVFLFAALLTFLFGDVVLYIDYHEMVRGLRHLPGLAVAGSIAATLVAYAAFVGREASALRYIGATVSWGALLISGICGSALGNALGFGVFSAAAVRYRIYGAEGVPAYDVARLVVFVVASFGVGLAGVGGTMALLEAGPVSEIVGAPVAVIRGLALLAIAAVAMLLLHGAPSPLRVGRFSLRPPSRRLMAVHLALTATRLLAAAAALWVLLPATPLSFMTFAAIFSGATAVAAVVHLPAGAGLFEIAVFWMFRGRASTESVAAALIAYRGIYFLLPLVVSAVAFSGFELAATVGGRKASPQDRLARAAARLSPTFLGVFAFGIGVMLLVSGATPIFGKRLTTLSVHVPLWVVESSSLAGGLFGVAFLFVARGLLDRRDGAWRLATFAGLASLALAFAKGLAFGEASVLALFCLLLLATRRQFHRPTSMFDEPFTIGWFAAVGAILIATLGVLLLAFNDATDALHGLWWRFEFDDQAPRAWRAVLGAAVLAGALALRQLLRAPSGLSRRPGADELARASAVISAQTRGDAMLALMGDKSLLFSEGGDAFLMYGKRGRSWIALFDPVGPREHWSALIEGFLDLSRRHGGRAAFYQVRPENLPYYLDAGLSVMKLGEDAVVDLPTFELKGGATSHLRYALKRGERDGLRFELLAPGLAEARLDELADISNQWLEARGGDEKGFSVAAFEPDYVRPQYIGVLLRESRAVAFVTAMATNAGGEVALGLMRFVETGSPVAMELLFTKFIMAMKELGFQRFSLGAAPLAGIKSSRSAWHRIGAMLWKHGDRFYNFRGLRAFKNKFNPSWEPRYFAASGSLGPFVALADAAALIGTGSPADAARARD
jgi:phosphatidylglycerol lysyltransferase